MKVVCIGNRFSYPDSFGMEVYQQLMQQKNDFEVIEGGIGGLNLALHFETDEDIIIVDQGVGYGSNFIEMQKLDLANVSEYNHESAFYYLLKSLEKENIFFYFSNTLEWLQEDIDKAVKEIWNEVNKKTTH
ncbi:MULTISPECIES: hypothetical protein [Sulfurimonas]|uniref:hypothetical protein n=1 Tax=Sulfurimonas TaxID=202746 RepID=UPI001265868A|nr:hypothetical protein [Sulfurimonas indica]